MTTDKGIPQGSVISPILMNFTLNGIEDILELAKKEYKSTTKYSSLRYREADGYRLSVKAVARKKRDSNFKERAIACKIVRFADDFVVISGSKRLLSIIQDKIKQFLHIRGLEIHPEKSSTIEFGVNTPFDFLGYTFNYLIQNRYIRCSYLHHSKPEYRLKGRPRLYVYPSKNSFSRMKTNIIMFLRDRYNLDAYNLINLLNPMITG